MTTKPLTKQYRVGYHLDHLKHDYPEAFGVNENLEDIVPRDNPDLMAILDFRKACDQSKRNESTTYVPRKGLLTANWDYLIDQFKQGKTINACAKELELPVSTLKSFVNHNDKLKELYHQTRQSHHRLTKNEINLIESLWKLGYSKHEIARQTGFSRATVYSRIKKLKEDQS